MGGFASKYGPWALVTGASSGIGSEFARRSTVVVGGINKLIVLSTRFIPTWLNAVKHVLGRSASRVESPATLSALRT